MPTIDCVLFGPGNNNKGYGFGNVYLQLVCRRSSPHLAGKACKVLLTWLQALSMRETYEAEDEVDEAAEEAAEAQAQRSRAAQRASGELPSDDQGMYFYERTYWGMNLPLKLRDNPRPSQVILVFGLCTPALCPQSTFSSALRRWCDTIIIPLPVLTHLHDAPVLQWQCCSANDCAAQCFMTTQR